jgi:hypothetical protein
MASTQNPLVSIVIVNWNGGEILNNCLKSLSKLNYLNWELILVDNGSTDNSANEKNITKHLGAKQIKIIKNKTNRGFAPANNQGVKVAKGKYMLLLNNDTRVSPDLLKILTNKLESEADIGVIQPKIIMMDNKKYLDNAGSFMTRIGFLDHWGFGQRDSKEFSKEREIFSAKGACMLIRREIYQKIGLFDNEFVSYFEESDFCWRVWLSGSRVVYYPKAHIYHKVGFTIKRLDVLSINFHYYKNRINALIKNLELKNLLLIVPLHILISLGISLVFFLKLRPKNSIIIVSAIIWNIQKLPQTLKKRKAVQYMRKQSDVVLFKKHKLITQIKWNKFYNDFKRIKKDIDAKTKA